MLHLSEFVWTLRSSVWVVFNNFLLIDATDRSKISSDQKRLFIALSLYPLSFFANTPFISFSEQDTSVEFTVIEKPQIKSINFQIENKEIFIIFAQSKVLKEPLLIRHMIEVCAGG